MNVLTFRLQCSHVCHADVRYEISWSPSRATSVFQMHLFQGKKKPWSLKCWSLKREFSIAITFLCDVAWNLTGTKPSEVTNNTVAIFAFVAAKSSHLAKLSRLRIFSLNEWVLKAKHWNSKICCQVRDALVHSYYIR